MFRRQTHPKLVPSFRYRATNCLLFRSRVLILNLIPTDASISDMLYGACRIASSLMKLATQT
jgi:hypothetical protein